MERESRDVRDAWTFRRGHAWRVEIARNPVFSRIKWFPALMGGTSFVRRVRLLLRLVLEWSPLSALRGGDLSKIQCAVPLVFGDPGLQFALEWLQRQVVKVMFGR